MLSERGVALGSTNSTALGNMILILYISFLVAAVCGNAPAGTFEAISQRALTSDMKVWKEILGPTTAERLVEHRAGDERLIPGESAEPSTGRHIAMSDAVHSFHASTSLLEIARSKQVLLGRPRVRAARARRIADRIATIVETAGASQALLEVEQQRAQPLDYEGAGEPHETEGFDPHYGLAEPSPECRRIMNKWTSNCVFAPPESKR